MVPHYVQVKMLQKLPGLCANTKDSLERVVRTIQDRKFQKGDVVCTKVSFTPFAFVSHYLRFRFTLLAPSFHFVCAFVLLYFLSYLFVCFH
jgi:hypothetical protein